MTERWFGRVLAPAAAAALLAGAGTAAADVSVERGPTPLENGDAKAAKDITLRNDHVVVSIAAQSAPPWGVARGGIVDAAPIKDGEPLRDKLALVDLIPNNWSSWPTTYQNFEIVTDTPEKAVIRVERDWNDVRMVTRYTLREGSDRVHMVTTMTNEGDSAYEDILSGYVLWTDGGSFFSVPGLQGVEEGETDGALADWSAGYAEDWAIALHAPYVEYVDYNSRDLYLRQTLEPGDSRRFEGWLQLRPSGDLGEIVQAEIERKGLDASTVSGTVATRDGKQVDKPVVVFKKDGEPYAWTVGEQGGYEMVLPEGEYSSYATAKAHAQSSSRNLSAKADGKLTRNFKDLEAPGTLKMSVHEKGSMEPLDARVTVAEGQTPLVGYLGRKTFFTELENEGELSVEIAPGDYVFEVSHGAGFLSRPVKVDTTVPSGDAAQVTASIERRTTPNRKGWYAADLHHHSDVLDGYTPPEYVIRSELAEGLDLTLLSDHDSMVNLPAAAHHANKRDEPFIPGIEFSPSWAHFNAYPIEIGQELQIDPGKASVQQIFAEAERLGASVVQANHPFIAYGYFTSLNKGDVPGGFSPNFDFVELNGQENYEKAYKKARQLWSAGDRYYISAGSDVHDVWAKRSGMIRMFAKLDGDPTPESFSASMKQGHSFATMGPLVYPDQMFGETLQVETGTAAELGFTLTAASGLKSTTLYGPDGVVAERSFDEAPARREVAFSPEPNGDGWYSLVVTDANDKKAFTNPIWIDVVEHRQMASDGGE